MGRAVTLSESVSFSSLRIEIIITSVSACHWNELYGLWKSSWHRIGSRQLSFWLISVLFLVFLLASHMPLFVITLAPLFLSQHHRHVLMKTFFLCSQHEARPWGGDERTWGMAPALTYCLVGVCWSRASSLTLACMTITLGFLLLCFISLSSSFFWLISCFDGTPVPVSSWHRLAGDTFLIPWISENTFTLFSHLIDSLAVCRLLIWKSFSFWLLEAFFHCPLDYSITVEKSAVSVF